MDATPNSLQELVKSINLQLSSSNTYRRFQRMYANDRIAFAYDILPGLARTLAPYQEEILGLFDGGKSRVAVRGPHGLGKTTLASILVHHSVMTAEDDAKTITTASAWRQLEKYLWPEVRKTYKHIYWAEVGREPYTKDEFLSMSIRLNGGTVEAFAVACEDSDTIEGAHATNLTYIFDEAKSIPRNTWNAAEGAFSNANIPSSSMKELEEEIGVESPYIKNAVEESRSVETNIGEVESVPSRSRLNNTDINRGIAAVDVNRVIEERGNNKEGIDGEGRIEALGNAFSDANRGNKEGIEGESDANSINRVFNPSSMPSLSIQSTQGAPGKTSNPGIIVAKPESLWIRETESTYSGRPNNIYSNISSAIAFAISTPGEPAGQFYDIHMHKPGYEDWFVRHVTIEEAIRANRISSAWVEQRQRQWGVDSSIFQNRVLGEFADTSDDGIIPLSWIRAAVERWKDWKKAGGKIPTGKAVLGCDVARGGEDKTVIACRYALVLSNLHTYSKLPATATAGHILNLAAEGSKYIHIEMDGGIGATIYDILKEQNVPNLRPITVAAGTAFRDRSKELTFLNVRAAMWWNMRELLDPAYGSEVCLPPVDALILDLSTPRWQPSKTGRIVLEGKDSIRARLGRSTDYGDACCLSFWNASAGGGIVF